MRSLVMASLLLLAASSVAAQDPPSVELPAPLARVLRDYEQAWTGKDPAKLASLFTEDGFVLANRKPAVRGHAAIREAYKDAGGPLALRAMAYSIDGNTGYIIGAYGESATAADTGKFILALRRVRGRWLIAADIDNTNRGPQRPPAAP
jgi:ketosteroid isomerase-like protein